MVNANFSAFGKIGIFMLPEKLCGREEEKQGGLGDDIKSAATVSLLK